MMPSDKEPPAHDEADEQHPLSNEFRSMIEEYAHELRQIIEKLRKRLH